MNEVEFLTLLQKTMMLCLQLLAPVLIITMVVGLVISVMQAITQIQEATLTFVPKIIAGIITLIIFFPWMLASFTSAVNDMFLYMKK